MLGRFEESVADYSSALHIDSNNAFSLASRAAAYIFLEKYDDAIRDCSRSLQLNPSYTSALRYNFIL